VLSWPERFSRTQPLKYPSPVRGRASLGRRDDDDEQTHPSGAFPRPFRGLWPVGCFLTELV